MVLKELIYRKSALLLLAFSWIAGVCLGLLFNETLFMWAGLLWGLCFAFFTLIAQFYVEGFRMKPSPFTGNIKEGRK